MSERLKPIYAIERDLYTAESPIVIRSGELCRDIKGGGMVCRFVFTNVSDKTVDRVKMIVKTDDGVNEYEYYGLCAVRDDDFGRNELIPIEGYNASRFSFSIDEISFTDGSTWYGKSIEWSRIETPVELDEYFSDNELVDEFRKRYGGDTVYYPKDCGDLWYCTCGGLNHRSEAACHRCNRTLSELKKYDADELAKIVKKEKRIDSINKKIFEEAYKNIEADRKEKKSKTALYIFIFVIIITFVIMLIALDDDHYTQAVPRLEAEYSEKL